MKKIIEKEVFKTIKEFPDFKISNYGRLSKNKIFLYTKLGKFSFPYLDEEGKEKHTSRSIFLLYLEHFQHEILHPKEENNEVKYNFSDEQLKEPIWIKNSQGAYNFIEDNIRYSINQFGDVKLTNLNYSKNNRKIKVVKSNIDSRGHVIAGSNEFSIAVHRKVANYFVANPFNRRYVRHIDGNKQNNHYSNLQWTNQINNSDFDFVFNRSVFYDHIINVNPFVIKNELKRSFVMQEWQKYINSNYELYSICHSELECEYFNQLFYNKFFAAHPDLFLDAKKDYLKLLVDKI